MPHKSKKDKESSKSERTKKSDKNGSTDQDGKKVPPAAQLLRMKQPGSHSAVKREKRFSTSTFPLSANRELQKLTPIVGSPGTELDQSLVLVLLRQGQGWYLGLQSEEPCQPEPRRGRPRAPNSSSKVPPLTPSPSNPLPHLLPSSSPIAPVLSPPSQSARTQLADVTN
uniref:Uncharacterized protein n=1 Tax=Knipowitschia caucasica TaxID=637954 RepID=A0AAV2JEX1_KNICA